MKKGNIIFLIIGIFLVFAIIIGVIVFQSSNIITESVSTTNIDKNQIEKAHEISYLYNGKKITMEVPNSWFYELKDEKDEDANYIAKIYPNKDEKQKYIILNIDSAFGVCGTGLECKNLGLNNGINASVGYYPYESDTWQFISFIEYKNMYLWNFNLTEEEGNTALEMVKTLQYN